MRMTRAAVIDQLAAPYIEMVQLKGASPLRTVLRACAAERGRADRQRGRAEPVVPAGRRDHRRDHLQLPRHRQADGRRRDAARHAAGAGLRDDLLRRLPDPGDHWPTCAASSPTRAAAPMKAAAMTTSIHSGSVDRPALRRWRDRLAHFGADRLARPGRDRLLGRRRDLRPGAAAARAGDDRATASVFAADQRRALARHRLPGPRHAGARHRRRALHRRRRASSPRCWPAAPARCWRCWPRPAGGWIDSALSRVLDTLIVDPEQDVRAGGGRGLRLVGADADRRPRPSSTCPAAYRIVALAGRQHQRARLRDGGARTRRRHRLRHAAARSCPTSPGRCWPTSACASSTWCCCWRA